MIRDPLREVLDASERVAVDATAADLDPTDVAALRLARRRFGVSLPPPFIAPPDVPARLPIRAGVAMDGPAAAAVQRRAWKVRYRGLLSDALLDGLDLDYLGRYWIGRTAVSPSRRHRLLVAGAPGEVHAAIDTGPARPLDARGQFIAPSPSDATPPSATPPAESRHEAHDHSATPGEVRSLYVDPSLFGAGLGSTLLAAAEATLLASGFTTAVLWVVEGNARARAFYERWGWIADGATKVTPVEDEELAEVRYRLDRPLGPA